MPRGKVALVAFALGLAVMSQMVGCGKEKDTPPETETISPKIQEDIDGGKVFLDVKQYDKAVDVFASAASKAPDSGVAHYYLALTYAQWGKEKQAISEYKKLLVLNSRKADNEELVVLIAGFVGLEPYETKRLTIDGAESPSFSPDGRQIVFASHSVRHHEIYVMRSDGSNQRQLTFNREWNRSPSFSPDGQEIVFVSEGGGASKIYVMAADGSNKRCLTVGGAFDWDPSFSPDGRQILLVSSRPGKMFFIRLLEEENVSKDVFREICVMPSDGSNQRRSLVSGRGATYWFPSFSPDGREIVFLSRQDGKYGIYVMTSDGSNLRCLTTAAAGDEPPSFSPDGRQIVFESNQDGNPEIYVMASDGSNQRRLTFNKAFDWDPSFSSGGHQIVFVSHRDGNKEIYAMDLTKPIRREQIAKVLGVDLRK